MWEQNNPLLEVYETWANGAYMPKHLQNFVYYISSTCKYEIDDHWVKTFEPEVS